MKLLNHKAQNLSEYAIVIVIIVAVLTAMELYVKRGVQGTIKRCADEIGLQEEAINKDPIKGELVESVTISTGEGQTSTRLQGGSEQISSSQTSTREAGSYSVSRSGFQEGQFHPD